MITLDRVGKRYTGGQQALANLSFSLERGEFAFITGHSGAGKSTRTQVSARRAHKRVTLLGNPAGYEGGQ